MGRVVSLFVLLCAFWILLSGMFKPWLLIIGLVSVLLVTWTAWRMKLIDEEGLPLNFSFGALTYWPWLVVEIVKASIATTRIVLNPRLPIAPTMVRIKGTQHTATGFAICANSITLTPGTISVEAVDSSCDLLVHALDSDFAADLEEGGLDRRVTRFEAES